MARWRAVLGLVVGVLMTLSAFAHSLLGGAAMRDQMAKARVPPELVRGLMVGWHFGGASMLVFGGVVISIFIHGWRGEKVSMAPAKLIALAYVGFGAWALAISDFNPFFLAFLAPGLLLAAATREPGQRS